jgi:hypothetical protein
MDDVRIIDVVVIGPIRPLEKIMRQRIVMRHRARVRRVLGAIGTLPRGAIRRMLELLDLRLRLGRVRDGVIGTAAREDFVAAGL